MLKILYKEYPMNMCITSFPSGRRGIFKVMCQGQGKEYKVTTKHAKRYHQILCFLRFPPSLKPQYCQNFKMHLCCFKSLLVSHELKL